ncbi:hypothetical protein D3C75_623870 [compost metagenome]
MNEEISEIEVSEIEVSEIEISTFKQSILLSNDESQGGTRWMQYCLWDTEAGTPRVMKSCCILPMRSGMPRPAIT